MSIEQNFNFLSKHKILNIHKISSNDEEQFF